MARTGSGTESRTVSKTSLDNGVRIISRGLPHVRSVSMGVWVSVGARDESEAESGLSHFIEHMIFKGTRRRSAYEIAKAFDVIGGHTNAFTTMETTCYHAKVMDTHVAIMVDILGDILLNSVFDPVEIDKERPVIFQEIGMVEDNPEDYIHLLSEAAYWGDHPLGRSILGTRENVVRFDSEAIRSFFNRFYGADRIVISASGNLEHQGLVDLLAPIFEGVPGENGRPGRTVPQARPGVYLHGRDQEQVHLCIEAPGLPIADPDRFAYSLLNTIVGGNMSSRLFQEVRERRGLAYTIFSFMTAYFDSGLFGVYTAVDPRNTVEAVRAILACLADIRSIRVGPEELRDAKEYTKGCLMLSTENADNHMARLAQNEFHFGRHVPLEEVVANIEAVTEAQVQELAQSLFTPEAMALTLLGPLSDGAPFEELMAG